MQRVNGNPYEPNSLQTMYYGIVRQFRDEMQLEFKDSENIPIIKHLGAVKKSLRKFGMGNLPNKSDALTNKEINTWEKRVI